MRQPRGEVPAYKDTPGTAVDQAAIDSAGASGVWNHALLSPVDGTFVTGVPSGRVFRVRSGVATYVPSWAPHGGPKPTVAVDDADLDHAGAGVPWQHLISAAPISTLNATAKTSTAATATLTWTRPISAPV